MTDAPPLADTPQEIVDTLRPGDTFIKWGVECRVGPYCEFPPHVLGQYRRASEQCRRSHKRWVRLLHFIGNRAYVKTSRNCRKAKIREREEVYWHKRMQILTPYIQAAHEATHEQ